MIIAIDGPAASGKGTIARRIAAHYRLPHLDTGLLYRATAAALIAASAAERFTRFCATARVDTMHKTTRKAVLIPRLKLGLISQYLRLDIARIAVLARNEA